jgi:D-amino-acid dehydrogenase
LWQFYRSCNEANVNNAAPVLLAFNQWSKFLYEAFAEEVGLDFSFEKKGLLMLFKTSKQQKEEESIVKQSNQLGLSANLLSKAEVEQLERNVNLNILGGAYFPDDAHLHPQQFIQQLLLRLKQKGVQFLQTKVVDFDIKGQQVKAIIDSNQQSIPTQQVLCTAGTWSAQLLKKAGISILLQDGKGYSFTLPLSSNSPSIPSILAEAKVAITPMHQQLRIGGTLELGSLLSKKDKINSLRLKGILESTTQYYPQLDIQPLYKQTPWVGYRPCTPDGMPYMGKAPKVQNLFMATGHGMMGMSLGPATGKLMSQIITKQKTSIATELFKIDRF